MPWLRRARWVFYGLVLMCVAVYLVQLTREPASCPSDWLDDTLTPECNTWADSTLPFLVVAIVGAPVAALLAVVQGARAVGRRRRARRSARRAGS
jgi:hypothetical protein